MDIDEAVTAIIDIKDYKAIAEALATAKKAFIKNLIKVNSIIKPDINKKSTISATR